MPRQAEHFYQRLDQCYAQGDLQAVEQFLLNYTQQGPETPPSSRTLIAAYNELGSLYRGTSRYDQSLAAFHRAEGLANEAFGPQSSQYATILNNMAGTYRLMGDSAAAIRRFHQAMEIYRQAGEAASYPYASALNNLSLAYRETGQIAPAIQCLEQALTVIQTMPERRQELAITYNNLTVLYCAAGKQEQAEFCLDRALQEFEQCAEEENVHYAAGLNSLAGVLYTKEAYDRAIPLYQKAAEYTKRFFGENVEYAITYENMGRVYEAMGRWEDAIDCLARAKGVYERLFGPEDQRTRSAAGELRRLQEEHPL